MGIRLRQLLSTVGAPSAGFVQSGLHFVVLAYDPLAQNYEMARQEAAQGDGPAGTVLARGLRLARPTITGDGSVALFVNTDYDLCLVQRGSAVAPNPGNPWPRSVCSHFTRCQASGIRFARSAKEANGVEDHLIRSGERPVDGSQPAPAQCRRAVAGIRGRLYDVQCRRQRPDLRCRLSD